LGWKQIQDHRITMYVNPSHDVLQSADPYLGHCGLHCDWRQTFDTCESSMPSGKVTRVDTLTDDARRPSGSV
jgi:hypothetical protein